MKDRSAFVLLLIIILSFDFKAQSYYTMGGEFAWPYKKPYEPPKELNSYPDADLVIIDENTAIKYVGYNEGKISKNVVVKINTAKGLEKIKRTRLPESFDYAYDALISQQGRQSRNKLPWTSRYSVQQFHARKVSDTSWVKVQINDRYEHVKWIEDSGAFIEEEVYVYELQALKPGDIVEIHYEATFEGDYGDNLFYFNSAYPKLDCEFSFRYKVSKSYTGCNYTFPVMVPDSSFKRTSTDERSYYTYTDKVHLRNLQGINYPTHAFQGRTLPHLYVDLKLYRIPETLLHNDPNASKRMRLIKPVNFEWMMFGDTSAYNGKSYDKNSIAIRRFISTLPPIGDDSLNAVFFKALCDTLNGFRYLTRNHIYYNESKLENLSDIDHLQRRRLVGDAWRIYNYIFEEGGIFNYLLNVQDKRYGEHSAQFRVHPAYEWNLLALPYNRSYIYLMPRILGIKYHLNELPFYCEGALGALTGSNFQADTRDKESNKFKFIKTPKSSFNDNTRTENATVKISADSSNARLTIKESLSGQFSTLLRHLYLNEYIDSTVSPFYFKKCTAKPGARNAQIKLSSRSSDFPFRYTFNCVESIRTDSPKALDLTGWFSFLLSKETLPEKPTHTYYLDFEFSDSYNFLLDFSAPVDLKNAQAFTKQINSDLFKLESGITRNSESSYLLRVTLQVKQTRIEESRLDDLMQLVSALDDLNNFSLELEKK